MLTQEEEDIASLQTILKINPEVDIKLFRKWIRKYKGLFDVVSFDIKRPFMKRIKCVLNVKYIDGSTERITFSVPSRFGKSYVINYINSKSRSNYENRKK